MAPRGREVHPLTPRPVSYAALAARVSAATGPVRLVAVDGPGGSGKTTFAARLADAAGGAPVVHTDDLASHDTPLDWWWRLEEQVLSPLTAGRAGRFRRYDWQRRARTDWIDVPPEAVVVIEGVGAARHAIRDRLALSVWLQTDAEVRLARGLERDGAELREFWAAWRAAEDAHYRADPTAGDCDLVVAGAPDVAYDLDREFVLIGTRARRSPPGRGSASPAPRP